MTMQRKERGGGSDESKNEQEQTVEAVKPPL